MSTAGRRALAARTNGEANMEKIDQMTQGLLGPRSLLRGVALLLLAVGTQASAQTGATGDPKDPSVSRKNLLQHELRASDRVVHQSEVTLAPGALFPRHSHPGEELIYVLKGTWVYELDGQAPKTVKAGEVLFIPYGVVHSAKNVGNETGIELATHIVEKGKPLLTLAK